MVYAVWVKYLIHIKLKSNRIIMIRLWHMNDTIQIPQIISIFSKGEQLSSSEVMRRSPLNRSLVTIKRQLSTLTANGYLVQSGAGRSVKYTLSKKGWLLKPINVNEYLKQDPDERLESRYLEFEVIEPPYIELFSKTELALLEMATKDFRANSLNSDSAARKKELQRFIVEFSWKTSRLEGNTYDLLSTERLLLYGEKNSENTEHEAQMILNQKNSLDFILENIEIWDNLKIGTLEQLHSLVGENLDISRNLRKTLVGITGTNYRPPESEFQIRDALELLFKYIKKANNIFEKALLSILGVSYIQPFVDGNKRTSRLLGNAMLISKNYAPLSYRSVNDREYKEACLVFYEQNSIEPFKSLFIDQYIFSARNYNIAKKK